MRKILFSVLIVLLLIGAGFTLIKGINILGLKVYGMSQIKSKNNEIDEANEKLNGLIDVTYTNSVTNLEQSAETLKKTKSDYEEMALAARNKSYLQTDKYEIEFLWTKLGNYAKDEKVQIKIDVSNSSVSGLFDLKFYIAGRYLKVKDFIYDIENDSRLGFKIEDFNMVSVGSDNVQGSFYCKEINIDLEKIEENTSEENNANETENTNATGESGAGNNNTATENTTNSTTEQTSETNSVINSNV